MPHAYGVEIAFLAQVGSSGRLVIFNAEYDALLGIGHACGHNLIASASFSAFLSPGRVRLLGTPAEEGGGGKLKLIVAGVYKDAAASLMVYPGPGYLLTPPIRGVAFVSMLANVKMRVYFTSREAHAAMAPWTGVNALDVPHERIHGVFREAGERPNVTPAHCCVEYYVRSDTRANAERLWQRVLKCFEGAALATGCEMRPEPLNSYADAALEGTVSIDIGDVTYECPGFHGVFGIVTEKGQGNHTLSFAKAAGTNDSYNKAIECGKGMVLVRWKVLTDENFVEGIRQEWEEDMKKAA
ncbi:hypothetical protein F5882DRAFT_432236 [Hyaloscypha sp. PMI_1271]|nr:hypothetical protein F5882DRAFT_432236 [Hyaloscypha sp. PMI_1271]